MLPSLPFPTAYTSQSSQNDTFKVWVISCRPLFKTLQGLYLTQIKAQIPICPCCSLNRQACSCLRALHGLKPLPRMLFSQISIWLNVLLLQVFAEISPFRTRPLKLRPAALLLHSQSLLLFGFSLLQYLPPCLYSIIYWVLYLLFVFSLFSPEHKLYNGRGSFFVLFFDVCLEQA